MHGVQPVKLKPEKRQSVVKSAGNAKGPTAMQSDLKIFQIFKAGKHMTMAGATPVNAGFMGRPASAR